MSLPCHTSDLPFAVYSYKGEEVLELANNYYRPVQLKGDFPRDPGDSLAAHLSRRSTEYVRAYYSLMTFRTPRIGSTIAYEETSVVVDGQTTMKRTFKIRPLIMLKTEEEPIFPSSAMTYRSKDSPDTDEYTYTCGRRTITASYSTLWRDMLVTTGQLLSLREREERDAKIPEEKRMRAPYTCPEKFSWDGEDDVVYRDACECLNRRSVEVYLEEKRIEQLDETNVLKVAATTYVQESSSEAMAEQRTTKINEACTILGSIPQEIVGVRTNIPEFIEALKMSTRLKHVTYKSDLDISYNLEDACSTHVIVYSTVEFDGPEGMHEYAAFRRRVYLSKDLYLKPLKRNLYLAPRVAPTLTDFLDPDEVYAANEEAAKKYVRAIRDMGFTNLISSRDQNFASTAPDTKAGVELVTTELTPGYSAYVYLPTGQRFTYRTYDYTKPKSSIVLYAGTIMVASCDMQIACPRLYIRGDSPFQGWLVLKSVRARVKRKHKVFNLAITVAQE